MLLFQYKNFSELTVDELHATYALRSEVFVVEQNCIYQDIDGKDPFALHIIGSIDEKIVAYARIFAKGISYTNYASIGRIVISPEHRGEKRGHALVSAAIKQCKISYPKQNIKISAQAHLEKFYTFHGFISTGETYLEDGIPHIGMTLTV